MGDGVKKSRRAEGRSDAGSPAETEHARLGEDEGSVRRVWGVKLRHTSIEITTLICSSVYRRLERT